MPLLFTKMQAQGNDFIIINGLDDCLPAFPQDFVRRITERRYGVGCDQLLVLEKHPHADAAMRIFNNDGTEASNCGNGLRCAADLLMRLHAKDSISIALADRIVQSNRSRQGVSQNVTQSVICSEMGSAIITDQTAAHVDVEIGNPHSVFFEAVETFPSDRNIEIVTGQVADHVYLDIIERGAGRTPACGSGACATAAAIWHVEGHNRPLTIEMPGGTVTVSGSIQNLMLEGAVEQTFSGSFSPFD